MGVIVPDGEYQYNLNLTCDSVAKPMSVVLGLAHDGVGSAPTAVEAADALFDALTGSDNELFDASILSGEWNFLGVEGFRQSSGGPILGAHLETINGSGPATNVPVNCAVLVKKQTASGGRKNRGRFFFPPYVAGLAVNEAGVIQSSSADIVPIALADAQATLLEANLLMVIHHSDGTDGTPITGFALEGLLATQRRRLR